MSHHNPDILSHERALGLAKQSVTKWQEYKHRRSANCAENHKFAEISDSITFMKKGTLMVKLRASSKRYRRTYFLDEGSSTLSWSPSKKGDKARIAISSIKEVRQASFTDAFSQSPDEYDEGRCFSIIHGNTSECLDLVFTTKEDSMHWLVGLRYLVAKNKEEREPVRRQNARDQWLKEIFLAADKSGDGLLSVDEVHSLMHKLNVKISNRKIKEVFKAADTEDQDSEGLLDFNEFVNFYKSISTRKELYLLLLMYGYSKEHMTAAELMSFLKTEQGMSDVTLEHCQRVIQMYEPVEENCKNEIMGIDGFTNYLLGPDSDIFNEEHSKVHQDMTFPLTHYYIASSHNTYLLGDQLTSNSSMDMYVRVLQSGCRCLELDCWDGKDGEPVIYHGHTLTSKIKFRDVILNINEFAFANNKYPVILSLENHCSVGQQNLMAQVMKETFKEKLMYTHKDGLNELPSPHELMGKILIKSKKLPEGLKFEEDGEVTEDDSADEMEESFKFNEDEGQSTHKAKELKCRQTLASLRRLRINKDADDDDAQFYLKSALVSCSMQEEEAPTRKPRKRLQRSVTFGGYNRRASKSQNDTERAMSLSGSEEKTLSRTIVGTRAIKRGSNVRKTIRLTRQLSDLVTYTRSCAFKGLKLEENEPCWEVISMPESKALKYVDVKGEEFVRYTRIKLCRIYPAGYRIDSSNFHPQKFWNCGCQLVALNYQHEGKMLQLNKGRFKANGNCGYVLKPELMFKAGSVFNPTTRRNVPGVNAKIMTIKIISGQQLPKPRDSILGDRGEIIDPYVEIEVVGIPLDSVKYRTKTVIDNGFSPVWGETMKFKIHFPELALVRFAVWDEDPIGRDFIGQFTLPFTSVQTGYRHVHLEGVSQASIFVHVGIVDFLNEKNLEQGDFFLEEKQRFAKKIKRR